MATATKIERAEEQRDMKAQLTANQGLDRTEEQGIIFQETSPARRKTRIYHVHNGQPADVPEYIAMKALEKVDTQNGGYMFTAHAFACECGRCGEEQRAAEYKPGTVLCFLHKDAPDQPAVEELGLADRPCIKSNLGNLHSKRMHGIHKHHDEWEAYQALLEDKKEERAETRQQQQIDATLALAGKAVGQPVTQTATATIEKPNVRVCNNCSAEIEGKLADHNC